jgi:1L-myo-inositol 1-phosphate cytidylyltransferase / CDP-L-myo-inositol myo-inositolphosphotransferase
MDKGKPQDGIVSRYINRPISRMLTRVVLKFPITPTAWTLMILVFPVAGALALTRGGYWGFVVGTILYQIHSILDGCDGEIARAKNLQSERGERIDNWCDHAGTFLMVICLGIGMFGNYAISGWWRTFYLVEGIATAILLAVNEIMLAGFDSQVDEASVLRSTLYPRHREMMRRSGIQFLGERVGSVLVQITKRDVSLFAFMLLAIIGWPQGILHLLCIFAVISLALASKTRFTRAR